MVAELDVKYRARFGHDGHRISVGLQPGFPEYQTPWVDCQVMVAAQYIVLAGDVIDAECVKKQLSPARRGWKGWENGNGPSVWKHWAIQLGEIADTLQRGEDPGFRVLKDNREALMDMAIGARNKMVALEPELLAQSGSRPGREAKSEIEAKPAAEAEPHSTSLVAEPAPPSPKQTD